MRQTWECKFDFIIKSTVDSSENNGHGDFSVQPPNDSHLRIIIRLIYNNDFLRVEYP